MELKEKIVSLRKAHGMTQEDLAQALYVSRQSIYKWESGRSLPDLEKMKQLCRLFQVSADELLDMPLPKGCAEGGPSSKEREKEPEKANALAPNKRRKKRWLAFTLLFLLAAGVVGLLFLYWPPEVRQAIRLGIVPANLQNHLNDNICEKDFLSMLENTARLRAVEESPCLAAAVQAATNERLTREKAAYWLYCTHIWTVEDPAADLSIGTHEGADPLSSRDVYQDLNAISQPAVAAAAQPWEWTLCTELKQTGELFERYDGTREMDEQINSILYGPYYTAVTFCTAQKSFLNERPILESVGNAFEAKEKITVRDAIISAVRLYGAW